MMDDQGDGRTRKGGSDDGAGKTDGLRPGVSVDRAVQLILESGDSYFDVDIFRALGVRSAKHIKLLWHAETRIRKEKRIVYGPGEKAGQRVVLDAASTVRRGATFGATAVRKLKRAFEVVNSVDPNELDPEQRRHLQRVQDRQAQQKVLLAVSTRKKKTYPPGI
jgi:hypothetical protein